MMSRLIGENMKTLFLFNYLPLQIWTLKICYHILKTITVSSFKLGQLKKDDIVSRLIGEN